MIPSAAATPIAAQHFGIALLFLLAGSVGLVWIAPEMAAGTFASPHVAGVTHLFTLGWISTTIFGALCQLLPVALGAPLRWLRAGQLTLWTFAPGAALFAAGVATGFTSLHHAGILLVAVGVIVAAVNIGLTLARAKRRDVTWMAVALAMSFLVSTLVLGVVLLHNLHTGFLAAFRFRILAAHMHIAAVGWALIMIVGVSHRLLPMFLLANGADTRWTKPALVLLATGVAALTAGLIGGVPILSWIAVLLIECGIACFYWQVRCFYRARVKKKLDTGLVFAASGLACLGAAAIVGPLVLSNGPTHGRLAIAYATLGILGGIIVYIIGLFYKIVPLLAWTTRYGTRMGREKLPAVSEMYSQQVAKVQLVLMISGVTLLVTGTATASTHVARSGAVLFFCGVLLFASQMARVAYGGRS
jgi:hypothetical protein